MRTNRSPYWADGDDDDDDDDEEEANDDIMALTRRCPTEFNNDTVRRVGTHKIAMNADVVMRQFASKGLTRDSKTLAEIFQRSRRRINF